MRIRFLLAAAASCLPAALAAQAFEGTITRVAHADGRDVETRMWIKGDRARVEFESPMGPMAFLVDTKGTVTRVMDAQKRYMNLPGKTGLSLKYAATGKHETVAGHSCDDYRVEGGREKNEQICVATHLGYLAMGPAGPMGGADLVALKAQFPRGFVALKSMSGDGTVRSEVTKVERTAVSEGKVTLPKDYVDMRAAGSRP